MTTSTRRIGLAACLLLPLCAQRGTAQIPLGSEFRVDTQGAQFTTSVGTRREVTATPDGGFIVAWTAGTAGNYGIHARRFDSGGRALGPPVRVNRETTHGGFNAVIASDDVGNFVVAWVGGSGVVRGQRFDSSGAHSGAEFIVNQTAVGGECTPHIGMAPDGRFVVTWWGNYGQSILARRYDGAGMPVGGEFVVNTYRPLIPAYQSVDLDEAGNFVVVWPGFVSTWPGPTALKGRMFTAAGTPAGPEFVVNTYTGGASRPRVAKARDGSFVAAWEQSNGLFARLFDPGGAPIGGDFRMNVNQLGHFLDLDAAADGGFVVAWSGVLGYDRDVVARRFSSGTQGPEFRVNSYTTGTQGYVSTASDPAGNFVVVWHSGHTTPPGVFAQRYAGGLTGIALDVDPAPTATSDGNRVFEAGEAVRVEPSWLNAGVSPRTFTAAASAFAGPGPPGDPAYTIIDPTAGYGTVASGGTGRCSATADCYALRITASTRRPATHWDASLREDVVPPPASGAKTWPLHVGDSFGDVPRANIFYPFVETLLHHNVTAGCTAATYCPALATSREQMAVFVLVAKEGTGYQPPACITASFADVPASSPYCRWIEELARRGIVGGCGGGNYCPLSPVSRQEMAVFALATKDGAAAPPACGTPMFNDVPPTSAFCPWVEELARRGVVTGCGGGAYCPTVPVTREQMSVFLAMTFGLRLYGP